MVSTQLAEVVMLRYVNGIAVVMAVLAGLSWLVRCLDCEVRRRIDAHVLAALSDTAEAW